MMLLDQSWKADTVQLIGHTFATAQCQCIEKLVTHNWTVPLVTVTTATAILF